MVRTIRRTGLLVAAVAVLMTTLSPIVSAGGADVGIQPAYPIEGNTRSASIFIMTLKPEETGKNGVRLVNNGEEPHTVQIYPVDGTASADGSFSCRQAAEPRKEVGTWVKLSQEKLTIQPGEQEVVDFTVTVPKGTSPGEHNGCIAVQDQANLPATTGDGVLLGFRSAIRLSVRVPGKIVKQLEFIRVDIARNDDKYVVSPVVKNTGNVSLDMKSYAQLVSVLGQKSKVENNTSCPIVPGATLSSCGSNFTRPYWGGLYKARTSVSYNANVDAGLGDKDTNPKKISMTSAYFIAWPDPLAAAAEIAVLLLLIWLLITPVRRRIRRRRIIRNWEKYIVAEGDTIMSIAASRNAKWKRVARFNHLKAPYALQAGQPLIVPKQQAAKPKKVRRKRKSSELDWFLDAAPAAQDSNEPSKPATVAPVAAPSPVEPTPVPKVAPPAVPAAPPAPQSGWVTPGMYRDHAHGEADEEDEDFMDWREGAAKDELAEIETKLGDYSAMPHIRSQLPSEEEKPAKKTTRKKSTKTSKATKTKQSPKSKKGS
jgi:hypothetical protein